MLVLAVGVAVPCPWIARDKLRNNKSPGWLPSLGARGKDVPEAGGRGAQPQRSRSVLKMDAYLCHLEPRLLTILVRDW